MTLSAHLRETILNNHSTSQLQPSPKHLLERTINLVLIKSNVSGDGLETEISKVKNELLAKPANYC